MRHVGILKGTLPLEVWNYAAHSAKLEIRKFLYAYRYNFGLAKKIYWECCDRFADALIFWQIIQMQLQSRICICEQKQHYMHEWWVWIRVVRR
jgi:hypothetical protein